MQTHWTISLRAKFGQSSRMNVRSNVKSWGHDNLIHHLVVSPPPIWELILRNRKWPVYRKCLVYTSCQDKMKSKDAFEVKLRWLFTRFYSTKHLSQYFWPFSSHSGISALFQREFCCSLDNARWRVCAMLHSVNDGFNVHLFYFVWAVVSLW